MSVMKKILGGAAALALSAGALVADPAIIFDLGGKFDKSFNEAAFNGAEKWAKETGGTYKELEMQNEAQREQAQARFEMLEEPLHHSMRVPRLPDLHISGLQQPLPLGAAGCRAMAEHQSHARQGQAQLLDQQPVLARRHVERWLGGKSDYLKA